MKIPCCQNGFGWHWFCLFLHDDSRALVCHARATASRHHTRSFMIYHARCTNRVWCLGGFDFCCCKILDSRSLYIHMYIMFRAGCVISLFVPGCTFSNLTFVNDCHWRLFGRHCCSGTQGFSVQEQHLEWKAGTWSKVNFIYHVLTGLSRSFQNLKDSLERSERRFYLKAPKKPLFSSILREGTKNALFFVVANGAPDRHWHCHGHWFADRQVHAWCHQFCGTLCSRVSCHRCAEGFRKISNVWRCNLGNDTQLNGYFSFLYCMTAWVWLCVSGVIDESWLMNTIM